MINPKWILLYILLAVTCAINSACHDTSSSHTSNGSIPQSNENNLASFVDEDGWEFRLQSKLPEDIEQKRIRCTGVKLCWVWDSQSIWVTEGDGNWRLFYALDPRQSDTAIGIRSVHFISPSLCWLVRDHILQKTEDSGKSWGNVAVPGIDGSETGRVTSVYFHDKGHGWVAGGKYEPIRPNDLKLTHALDRGRIDVSCILETTDGGKTWRTNSIPTQKGGSRPVGGFNEIYFWNSEIGIASDRRYCVFTNNGGKTWDHINRFVPVSKGDSEDIQTKFVSAFFKDSNNGWTLFTRLKFEILVTNNGGRSWGHASWALASESNDDTSYPPPPRFIFVDDRHGLFVYSHTGGGELFKTADAGRTWEKIRVDKLDGKTFYDIFFTVESGGFLVGSKGVYSFSLR